MSIKSFSQFRADNPLQAKGYLEYVANLSQVGSDDPTADVLIDELTDIGVSISYSTIDTGAYEVILSDDSDTLGYNVTAELAQNTAEPSGINDIVMLSMGTNQAWYIYTSESGGQAHGVLRKALFVIKFYPT